MVTIVASAHFLIDSLALLLVICGAFLLCYSAAHFLTDCGALLGWNCGADDITDRETLLVLGHIYLCCADLVSNILALKILDSCTLLLPHRCTPHLLHSCTHPLTTRAALLLLYSLHLSLTLWHIYTSTHCLLCVSALLLLCLHTLLLCVRDTLLLSKAYTHISILCTALLLSHTSTGFFIHCHTLRSSVRLGRICQVLGLLGFSSVQRYKIRKVLRTPLSSPTQAE